MTAPGSTRGGVGTTSRAQTPFRENTSVQPNLEDTSGQLKGAGDEAKDTLDALTTSVKDAARSTSRVVKEQAAEFASDVGHELGKTAEEQKQRGVEAMHGVVRAVHTAAAELQMQSPRIAGYVRDAADKVERLSSDIGKRDINQLMKSASELARSQPMLFFAGAVAAGFALSRFLKSSAPSSGASDDSSSEPEYMS